MTHKPVLPNKLKHEDIARRAYAIYEKRNYQPGHDLDDWLEAEKQLRLVATESRESETPARSGPVLVGGGPSSKAKSPLDKREHPLARDERGAPTREEIRRRAVVTAPRGGSR